jgi:hypothetical protein
VSRAAAGNPDAGRDPVELLVEQVELCLERPHDPINSLDRVGWSVAIRSEMPWVFPSMADAAGIILEQRYWSGKR